MTGSSWQYFLQAASSWLPYLAVVIAVPTLFFIFRCVFRGSCRNGPIQRRHSSYDEEYLKFGENRDAKLFKNTSVPDFSDIHKTVHFTPHTNHLVIKTNSILKSKPMVGSNLVCGLCNKTYSDESTAMLFACKHQFHQICGQDWLQRFGYCPLCVRPSTPPIVRK